jgi:hypothetical protein
VSPPRRIVGHSENLFCLVAQRGYASLLHGERCWFESNTRYQFCSISIMVILRFCSPAIVVRFLDGAPSFVKVSARKITLQRFLRRTNVVKGWRFESSLQAHGCRLDGFQVTYRVPLELVTRVNGAYNYGSTSLTNLTDPRLAKLCGEQLAFLIHTLY